MRLNFRKISRYKVILLVIAILGISLPYCPSFVIIEFFFLLTPFAIILLLSTLISIPILIFKIYSFKKTLFFVSIVPLFISSQILSSITVNKIQKIRSELLIDKIENIKQETGEFPKNHKTYLGIRYIKIDNEQNYVIRYSRGFMITEKYYHKQGNWRSYGWND